MEKINIFYLGLHYNKEEEEMLMSICKNGISAAHFVFQENIIKGLKLFASVDVNISLPVGSFPLMSNKLIFKNNDSYQYNEIGFLNLPFFKDKFIRYQVKQSIIKWMEKIRSDEKCFVVIYDAYLPYILGALKARKKYKKLFKIICIIPDLPGKYGIEANSYNCFINKYIRVKGEIITKKIRQLDGFVLLTKHMSEALGIENIPSMVMECIVNDSGYLPNRMNTEKTIAMYAGELSEEVDLDVLIEAMKLINDESIELWICGTGRMENVIKQVKCDNIKFLGYIQKEQLMKIQEKVNIFINPRQNTHNYVKYSFPSKNAETLKTGKPLIGYKLDGIPDEYDEFIYYPYDNTALALAEEIKKVAKCRTEDRIDRAERQISFMKLKTYDKQAERIVEFMKEI